MQHMHLYRLQNQKKNSIVLVFFHIVCYSGNKFSLAHQCNGLQRSGCGSYGFAGTSDYYLTKIPIDIHKLV